MTDVESASEDIRNIFCHFKDNQNRILINALNHIPTCNGGHSALTRKVGNMFWCRRVTYFYQTVAAVTMTIIFVWFLRSYNHANIFGGCAMNFLWDFDDCPIAF